MRNPAVIESPALCNCSSLTEVEVKTAIRDRNISDSEEARRELGWRSSGCSVCRPVLNYFVTMFWTRREFIDVTLHRRGRRVEVVELDEGDSAELERPHDPSSHRDDSLQRRLRFLLAGLWTPARLELALGHTNGRGHCPDTDAGLLWGDRGWCVYVGGVSGDDYRRPAPIGWAGDDSGACRMVAALLQLYREEGRYNERVPAWRRRVGLDMIRRRVVEDSDSRHQLLDRLEPALRSNRSEAWNTFGPGVSNPAGNVSARGCFAAEG